MAAVTGVVSPIGDRSRARRLVKVGGWLVVAVTVVAALEALGVDIGGWIGGLWDSLRSVSPWYLAAGVALQTLQTALIAVAWMFILRAGNPQAHVPFAPVLAAYAAGSALNGVLPASLGTVVTLFLFVAIIPEATFPGVLAALVVQKLFFTVMGVLVYLYLFVSVPGSFTLQLGGLEAHPVLMALAAGGAVSCVVLLGRALWPRLHSRWLQAKQGGAILGSGRRYLVRVALPCSGAYAAKLAATAVFLVSFSIPATFGSVLHVMGGNSIAGATAATPGGAGVNEAVSVVALAHYTDAQTATAFSVAQHLVSTGWSIVFALILVSTVFGWTNGEALLKSAYGEAKERARSHRG